MEEDVLSAEEKALEKRVVKKISFNREEEKQLIEDMILLEQPKEGTALKHLTAMFLLEVKQSHLATINPRAVKQQLASLVRLLKEMYSSSFK